MSLMDMAKTTWRALYASHSISHDNRAVSGAVNVIVTIAVAALVAAFLIPVAVDEIAGVDTSSWSSGASSLWGVMGLIVVLAVFIYVINLATDQ